MPIALTADGLRKIFPRAPEAVIAAFVAKQHVLDRAGVNHTRNRLAFAFAQVEHESAGLTHLRENINYTPQRAAEVWKSRFHGSVSEVYTKTGSFPGDPEFRTKLIDHVYGGRMGNRPGTHDGSIYIGRAGPQLTGRDCYAAVGKAAGVDLVNNPALAERAEYQPEALAGFVNWKGLNAKADLGDFKGYVRVWNGGLIGYADREAQLAGNDPFIARLEAVNAIKPVAKELPGKPPTPDPPKNAIDAATPNERRSRKGGAAVGGAGGANEGATQTGTVQPDKAPLSSTTAWVCIGIGVALVIVATVLIARKRNIIKANWN